MILKWEVFQDFCRKLEGQPLSQAECLFMLAGEAQAIGLPDQVTQEARWRTPEVVPSSGRAQAADPRPSRPGEPENVTAVWPELPWDPQAEKWCDLFDPTWYTEKLDRDDPLALDRRIVATRNLLQQLHRHLARRLRRILDLRLYEEFGFSSFESYVQERLGISKSRAFELVRTDRLLDLEPVVREAYNKGILSVTQASALVRVTSERSAEGWIQFARTHPVTHLLRVVRYCRVASFSHPELLKGRRHFPPSREVELRLQISALDRPEDADPDRPYWPPLEELTETLSLSGQLWVVELLREVMLRVISLAQRRMRPWEALELLIDDFVETHGQLERREPYVLVRDDYRCQVPCCTRSVVEVHHIRFRSASGSNEPANRLAICPWHHAHGIHAGRIGLSGSAPLDVSWLFRLQAGGKAFAYYKHQRRVWPRVRAWRPGGADLQERRELA
jgi:hypothetical protein